MRRLLILACSQTKSAAPGYIPAYERYTGPLWQTLRAADPDGRLAFASVLSARYGWRDADGALPAYEQRMTPARVQELYEGGITEGWPKTYRNGVLCNDGTNACGWLASAAGKNHRGFCTKPFSEVCIVGGADYCKVAETFAIEANVRGFIVDGYRTTVINDQIGYMRQQLRAWLTGSRAHVQEELAL